MTQTQEGTPCPDKGVDASGIPRDGLQLKFDSTTNHVSLPGFTYDSAGNQTRTQRADGSGLKYRYDFAGRLSQTRADNGNILEVNAYGADARRIMRLSGPNAAEIT